MRRTRTKIPGCSNYTRSRCPRTRLNQVLLRWWRMEAAEIRRLADNVAIHRLQQILARCGGRQIQLRIQSVELEHVVMDRPRSRARPEIGSGISAAGRNARTVPRSVGQ